MALLVFRSGKWFRGNVKWLGEALMSFSKGKPLTFDSLSVSNNRTNWKIHIPQFATVEYSHIRGCVFIVCSSRSEVLAVKNGYAAD
ncbi:hypothetical protein V6N11_032638 [Hibiscus sabdariffa]|uniref:Uncharacterized protein n=1 Tax=Hibiscus sabdariffa TaxID=183260 RepID=A0ABR2T215_9ROSI